MLVGNFLQAQQRSGSILIGLLQRVSRAWVEVQDQRIAEIGTGLLVLVAIEPDDNEAKMHRLLARLLAYRVFEDSAGRMNLALGEVAGGLLLVPQFTLAANTNKGNRPSFSSCAEPAFAQDLFERLVVAARKQHTGVGCGRFGADMQVGLVNDGPVTFWLHVR